MSLPKSTPVIEQWHASVCCCDPVWEAAYQRFETPEQEIRKMRGRLIQAGAKTWRSDAQIVELFCGRGNGLKALASLGFANIRGVDLSVELLQSYDGSARLYLGDCREIKLPDRSLDLVIVHGGLHHLPALPEDLKKTLFEVRRVLHSQGRFMMVEPWLTPFLRTVHFASRLKSVRWLWPRIDALATMIERERKTYENWLNRPEEILSLLRANFDAEQTNIGCGKIIFVGRPSK